MVRTNFTHCHAEFQAGFDSGNTTILNWAYRGIPVGIPPNPQSQITYEGCRALCGATPQFYGWGDASNTITTWILPIIGVLLQAPFESNKTWKTIEAIARWVGSPIASLSYTLWNVRVLGKCAAMVDMSTLITGPDDGQKQDFYDMRDSLFILGAMNQFMMSRFKRLLSDNPNEEPLWGGGAAEGLLRIMLFSKDLPLKASCDCNGNNFVEKKLVDERRKLAHNLRVRRRRGIVPVFVSTGWFLFALGLSIQSAFGQLGENAVAHDLALGLVLAWLPVLVLCSIVDRNPTDPDGAMQDMNDLVRATANALLDEDIFAAYKDTQTRGWNISSVNLVGHPAGRNIDEGLEEIRRLCRTLTKHGVRFFNGFAGQGRVRWHYGAAHPILSDIEDIYIAEQGRDWLRDEKEARANLVLGHVGAEKGLIWYDPRELWQILSASVIVGGTCFGAFILSYNTPTVGLGCRSGGYMIFVVMAVLLMLAELLIWWIEWTKIPALWHKFFPATKPPSPKLPPGRPRTSSTSARPSRSLELQTSPKSAYLHVRELSQDTSYSSRNPSPSIPPRAYTAQADPTTQFEIWKTGELNRDSYNTNARHAAARAYYLESEYERFEPYAFRKTLEKFLILGEFLNMCWLIYIVVSQTFGIYKRCECLTSSWELGIGGYFDFTQNDITDTPNLLAYWVEGTVVGSVAMCAGLVYVVSEWALQSHMNTLDEIKAADGLRSVRRWRKLTYPVRWTIQTLIDLFDNLRGRVSRTRMRSLKWTPYPTRRLRRQSTMDIITERHRRGTSASQQRPWERTSSQGERS
ncbi:hypothetical protein KVT40_001790 [Elsinoe batatas]|uniref:Uncharacterized protein n=1 Tax=Elsinoe batatas TaxID=2601811 RepID=A0A8K0L9C2_9PEZI|nr:hypothetical protein KVT40_001790 [Elsinoe batatas]